MKDTLSELLVCVHVCMRERERELLVGTSLCSPADVCSNPMCSAYLFVKRMGSSAVDHFSAKGSHCPLLSSFTCPLLCSVSSPLPMHLYLSNISSPSPHLEQYHSISSGSQHGDPSPFKPLGPKFVLLCGENLYSEMMVTLSLSISQNP